MEANYKSAGVDIKAGEETVNRIKAHVKSTFNKNVLMDIGHFGAFYELPVSDYKEPVLVSSVDGVGTKLKIAFAMNKHDTVGQDLVNHCVNDIAVCGAKPLYFMDYLAFGKLYPDIAEKIIEGFSVACRQNGCALIGGETAEMPGFYALDEYDMSGTIVGVVEKSKIIDGRNIKDGDVLIGFKSNGLHTNGYSLARKVLLEKFKLTDVPEGFNQTLGEELLKVHKSYLPIITKLKEDIEIKGFSHITGGGIVGNTKRIIPKGLELEIDWKAWEWQPTFKLIQHTGNVADEEMREVFNLGIGLIAVVEKENIAKVKEISKPFGEEGITLGYIK
ncbi:MAG: phosphoribosylformylglycinamidine cyclo-ligase [Ignavibacteriales bacterium]|nr:phosphoribosylformylglycinamidine cyclo-ligase [Ignavibacteriales bacterium]